MIANTGPAMNRAWNFRLALLVAVFSAGGLATVGGMEIELKDGRVLRGKRGLVAGMAANPLANPVQGPGSVPLIEVLDDDLRRTFVSKYQVKERRLEEAGEAPEKIHIRQMVARSGRTVQTVGPLLKVEPFDVFGRRTVTMLTAQGEVKIVQGITELTPTYARVEGFKIVWDMRMATSNIPHEQLAAILKKRLDASDINDIKRIANFYQQCERYEESARELEAFLAAHADNPNIQNIKQQLEPPLQAIKRLSARRLLSELRLRRDAGQHQLVQAMLKKFPAEGAAGETLQEVREILRQYETSEAARAQILARLAAIAKKIGDEALRKRVEPVLREIGDELNLNTMDRMAAFREMADDATISAADKLALAVSGWLLGSKGAMPRLSTAMSLVEVRRKIRQYLQAGDKLGREQAVAGFPSEEGASPALVARLLAHMTPPVAAELPAEEGRPCEFEVPGPNPSSVAVRCLVALPPEYDPHRRYPAILSLHGAGFTPEQQIDWWAGERGKRGWRAGQASRFGYIVIAPEWAVEHQRQYQYSAREHAAVLDSLRAACQRFSVDTDRVFLSGYSMGGDAAWDIGTAHPDLWAGVIPIAARGDKYCSFYFENAALVPLYFVIGELDSSRIIGNSLHWDRYLRKGYNTTVVEYQGRGHENFSDEILRLFDWMGRLQRNFAPKKFTAVTMRPWDNFFWWIELRQLPPGAMVAPDEWPPRRGAIRNEAVVYPSTNAIQVQTGAGQVTVWLSPDLVDLGRRVSISINGKSISPGSGVLAGDVGTILEDARTRGDRQHPFWSKIESPTGRVTKN
jgi:dienelactone hydrolase